ncbi:MAG TPA: HAMP domain-containing sensor histidine kinase [Gemmata sp.]|jgi:signal transduction histidine kinase|nr:HAMP domain-containing sensor histidine kinase [Gemmata sp.]
MRLSLRYRLLLPLTLLLIGDAAATAWAAAAVARVVERRLATQQWAVARTLSRSTFRLTEPILEQMKGFSGAEFIFVPPRDRPESTFPDPKPAPPTDVPTATQPQDEEEHTLGPPVELGGNQYRCLRLQLRPPHPDAGANLYILYPESLRRTAVRDAVRPLLILGGLGGLVAVALAFAYGSRLVRRIRDLEARTRLIAAGDFQPMPIPTANDELRDLCNSVNDMARRLAEFQDQLQRTERLRVLGQFSGGLAHQLRNAAAGAKLAVELFLAENATADPEPLRVALRQLARIETNLRQFLDLGKPPTDVRKPCDLVKLIDQAITLLKPQCQHTGTVLVWNPGIEPRIVSGDPTPLSHLFGNVIGNAVEAAGPGGTVEVRILDSDTKNEQRTIAIEIADTGPGPPPSIALRLFEPFVTGKDQGIGLGLAVAKQTIDAHRGRIEWSRREGRTVFRIELPIGEAAK